MINREFPIHRPGHKYPWVVVIQEDGDEFAWGVYSQSKRVDPFFTGREATEREAEAAARAAVE